MHLRSNMKTNSVYFLSLWVTEIRNCITVGCSNGVVVPKFESELERKEGEYKPYRYAEEKDIKVFMKELPKQLKITIQLLEEKGESFSLLAQDLIPKDITRIFKGVPSPDNDFM